jgi:peptidoglycan hydrolase-like protein with peptidoglycan-binding domain
MDTIALINGSVGQGGANQPSDVRIVQRLLNDWLAKERQTQLKVDGLVGPKTLGAITAFQKRNASIADGRLDPMGPTINSLFNKHLAGLLDMIDLSRLSKYVDESVVKRTSLSDPAIAAMIQQYVSVLRKQA